MEIFKHIEELYHGDTTDEAILQYAEQNSAKMEMWRKGFEGYMLRDVLDTVDDYFAHKNNKTPPRIAQIKAMMNANNIHGEEVAQKKQTTVEPDYDLKYAKMDLASGDFNWLTSHYSMVLALIRRDYYPFVKNIYHPTHEEFRECMRRWCLEKYGRAHYFFSDNEIVAMTPEKQKQLLARAKQTISGFAAKRFN